MKLEQRQQVLEQSSAGLYSYSFCHHQQVNLWCNCLAEDNLGDKLTLSTAYSYILMLITAVTNMIYGPGISVGIATGYVLDGPGIEFQWGRDFPHLSRPALVPTHPPVQWVPGLSQG
jgi:hypothetical protein